MVSPPAYIQHYRYEPPTAVTHRPAFNAHFQEESPKKRSVWDYLATTGSALFFLTGSTLLFSPLIAKKPDAIAKALTKATKPLATLAHRLFSKPSARFPLLESERYETLRNKLADRKNIEKTLWRLNSFFGFLLGINQYQTAMNTKQPSMMANAVVGSLSTLSVMAFPGNVVARSLAYFNWAINAVGKMNDIDNSNHPDKRREWDLKRLTRFFKPGESKVLQQQGINPKQLRKQESQDLRQFIWQDVKHTFSFTPWKELAKNYRQKDAWSKPQSYQTALAAQLYILSGLNALIASVFKLNTKSASLLVFAGDTIFNLPLFVRAWQNKSEPESTLMLASLPVSSVGNAFRISSDNLSFLSGLSATSAFTIRGLSINSKRYRALVDYLDHLYHYAEQNPALTAKDAYQTIISNPDAYNRLQKEMGKSRLKFLLNTLQKGMVEQQEQGISFSEYLKPLVSAKEIS